MANTTVHHSFEIRDVGGPGEHTYSEDPSNDTPSSYRITLIETTYTYGKTGKIIRDRTVERRTELCELTAAGLHSLISRGVEVLTGTVEIHDANVTHRNRVVGA